jgi:uncharacterized protein YegJ (DUF2314 family)
MRPFKSYLLTIAVIASAIVNAQIDAQELRGKRSEAERVSRSNSETIVFRYCVYYLSVPDADPRLVVDETVKTQFKELNLVKEFPAKPDSTVVLVEEVDANDFPPPNLGSLQYFGRGLDQRQAHLLQDSRKLLVLTFVHPKRVAWEALQNANKLLEIVARDTKGLIWDDETRLIYSPDAWRESLLESKDASPKVSDHITIHAYNTGEYARAITLGMSKFGLPDVVVEDFSWSLNRPIGNLITVFCQALVEGAEFQCPGKFDLDLKSIKNKELRDSHMENLENNSTANARLVLRDGKAEEGDPPNDLIELKFDRYEGPDVHAKHDRLLTELFGSADSAVNIDHDAKLLDASNRAKAKLTILKGKFAAGLRPNEYLLVKAPFDTPEGGHEWMWVEVIKWEGADIEGLLKNEPHSIPKLHGGQIVKVREDDLFDYLHVLPDGKQEGNETGRIIAEMQE